MADFLVYIERNHAHFEVRDGRFEHSEALGGMTLFGSYRAWDYEEERWWSHFTRRDGAFPMSGYRRIIQVDEIGDHCRDCGGRFHQEPNPITGSDSWYYRCPNGHEKWIGK